MMNLIMKASWRVVKFIFCDSMQYEIFYFYLKLKLTGSVFTLNITGGCYNFKRKWIDRISSAQVETDSCMIAWKNENCNGHSIKLLPSSIDLEHAAFNKKIRSISLCTEISFRPMRDIIGDRMWNPTKTSGGADQTNPGIDFNAFKCYMILH